MHSNEMETTEDGRIDWLVMWDMHGLESVFNLSEWKTKREVWEKSKIWSELKGTSHAIPPPEIPFKNLILRARHNSHRYYEIYTFASTDDINDRQDILDWFDADAQSAVNWIRKNGRKVFGEGIGAEKKVIQ